MAGTSKKEDKTSRAASKKRPSSVRIVSFQEVIAALGYMRPYQLQLVSDTAATLAGRRPVQQGSPVAPSVPATPAVRQGKPAQPKAGPKGSPKVVPKGQAKEKAKTSPKSSGKSSPAGTGGVREKTPPPPPGATAAWLKANLPKGTRTIVTRLCKKPGSRGKDLLKEVTILNAILSKVTERSGTPDPVAGLCKSLVNVVLKEDQKEWRDSLFRSGLSRADLASFARFHNLALPFGFFVNPSDSVIESEETGEDTEMAGDDTSVDDEEVEETGVGSNTPTHEGQSRSSSKKKTSVKKSSKNKWENISPAVKSPKGTELVLFNKDKSLTQPPPKRRRMEDGESAKTTSSSDESEADSSSSELDSKKTPKKSSPNLNSKERKKGAVTTTQTFTPPPSQLSQLTAPKTLQSDRPVSALEEQRREKEGKSISKKK